MEEKIFDLLNDTKINLEKYQVEDLSAKEKRRVKKKVLQEVSNMRGINKEKGMKGRKAAWKFAGLAAAACLAVSIAAVGSSSSAAKKLFSETFQKIISGTEEKKDGEYFKDIYTKIGKESVPVKAETQTDVLETEDSGVTMRVSDIYCDGYMMYYTLVLETDNPILTGEGIDEISTEIAEEYIPTCSVKIDGEGKVGDIIRFDKQADGTYTSVQNCSFYATQNPREYQNGDVIPVEIAINRMAGWDCDKNDKMGNYVHTKAVRGDWKLSFQAAVDTSENVTQKIGKEKNGVKIVKAVRTKASLNLEIELPDFSAEPFHDKYNDPDIWIEDQDGKDMQWLGNYNKKQKDGTRILYLSLLDDEGENYKLQVADRKGRTVAAINFKVKR